jgi:hypothetical protein
MKCDLTIGMAVYDDHEGLTFTLHSLMAHHAEVMPRCEILVVDNHPGSASTQHILHQMGMLAASSREVWEQETAAERPQSWKPLLGKSTYVPFPTPGTSYPREEIWKRASGRAVVCLDSHVFLPSGVLATLLDFYAAHPDTMDIYQGPLMLDNHRDTVEAFSDVWSARMWGQWASDERGKSGTWEPFDITGQGLGLFTCRKEAWIPFPPGLRGFGGEENSIHLMWRNAGRRTQCLPGLKWWHKFRDQLTGTPYPNDNIDRLRNYVVWAHHNAMPTDKMREHFIAEGVVTAAEFDRLEADPQGYEHRKDGGCGSCGGRVAEDVTLQQLFDQAVSTGSDLNVHLPKLFDLAKECPRILEIATRNQSTVAFLHAKPQNLASLNSAKGNDPVLDALESRAGESTLAIAKADCMAYEPEEVDLLFIDEGHTADRVYAQLDRFGTKTTRYIVLHDTVVFGESGENGGPGILPAVRRWLKEHPEWSVIYHTREQHGLTVLGCRLEDKPVLPNISRQAWNYVKALTYHVASGVQVASREEIDRRLEVCQLCPQRTGNRCSECGCYLDEDPGSGREGKALWLESECPLGKWHQ